jgi:ribosomal-protein-alanine N-acetyltransferase
VPISGLPPTLEWSGYRLRGLRLEDVPRWYELLSLPIVTEHTSYPPQTPESVRALLDRCLAGYASGSSCRWAIATVADNQLVGTCGFNTWSPEQGWAELAYELSPDRWGRGLMSEAVRRALRWAFHSAGFERVHAVTCVTNERSAQLLEHLGFSREGTLRSFRRVRGTPRDFWMYSLLKAELPAS